MNEELKMCSPVDPSEGKDTVEDQPIARERLTATERMRQHRTRRRNGLHCITVLLHEDEIDVLIGKGFLRDDRRRNHRTLEHALNVFICEALGPG
jgi:hypothetical protein